MINTKYKIKKYKLGFYQISPIPSAEEITKFYTGKYKNFYDSQFKVQAQEKYFF